jgi:hypothetical protein
VGFLGTPTKKINTFNLELTSLGLQDWRLLNSGGGADIDSVSCASAGNCTAGGYYTDASQGRQAFVSDETGGTWGTPEEVPGTAELNAAGSANVESVSCASVGNCSVAGFYASAGFSDQALVASEADGTWGTAEEVPGTAQLDTDGEAQAQSVSCASAGNCSAGGYYTDASGWHVFVVNEVNGRWGSAEQVPGTSQPEA